MVERIANKIFWNREAARSNIAQVNRFLMMVTLFILFVNFQIDFTAQTLVGLKYLVAYINSNLPDLVKTTLVLMNQFI